MTQSQLEALLAWGELLPKLYVRFMPPEYYEHINQQYKDAIERLRREFLNTPEDT